MRRVPPVRRPILDPRLAELLPDAKRELERRSPGRLQFLKLFKADPRDLPSPQRLPLPRRTEGR